MWRREEGLKYWLRGLRGARELKQSSIPTDVQPRKQWLQRGHSDTVRDHALDFRLPDIHPDNGLEIPVSVKDGIGKIRQEKTSLRPKADDTKAVYDVCLTQKALIRALRIPDEKNTRPSQAKLEIISCCRLMRTGIGSPAVRSPGSVQLPHPLVGGNGTLIPCRSPILSMLHTISALPIRRHGIDASGLSESEYDECRREAEQAKGIPMDRCVLLALFRNIPIEMVSRLHFSDGKKEIVYSLSGRQNKSRTRVYDLIAIRDVSGSEVHLIPHRVRNRIVSLN